MNEAQEYILHYSNVTRYNIFIKDGKEISVSVDGWTKCNRPDCNCVGSWGRWDNLKYEEDVEKLIEEGAVFLRHETEEI